VFKRHAALNCGIIIRRRRKYSMKHGVTTLVAAFAALCVFAGPVRADILSGMLSGDSMRTATSTPGVFIQYFMGEGTDDLLGPFDADSSSTVDFSHPPDITFLNGMFVESFPGGALYGTSSGDGTASGTGTATVEIDILFTKGTGIFAGDTGSETFEGMVTTTGPATASLSGTYSGTLSTVPEPSSLALLATLAGIFFLGGYFRRPRKPAEPRP
jgi:hypothetical protein